MTELFIAFVALAELGIVTRIAVLGIHSLSFIIRAQVLLGSGCECFRNLATIQLPSFYALGKQLNSPLKVYLLHIPYV